MVADTTCTGAGCGIRCVHVGPGVCRGRAGFVGGLGGLAFAGGRCLAERDGTAIDEQDLAVQSVAPCMSYTSVGGGPGGRAVVAVDAAV